MSEDAPAADAEPAAEPPYKIESARSSRSKCKTCRRSISKGKLRLGIHIVGPFGPGYLWHHLKCAARRRFEDVERAYAEECWEEGLELPSLDSLRLEIDKSAKKKAEQKNAPYVELAPTGRSKCKHCGELIEQGSFRVGLVRRVEFYGQIRTGPINVHPSCVASEMATEDCVTVAEGFREALIENSSGVEPSRIDEVCQMIGELPQP